MDPMYGSPAFDHERGHQDPPPETVVIRADTSRFDTAVTALINADRRRREQLDAVFRMSEDFDHTMEAIRELAAAWVDET